MFGARKAMWLRMMAIAALTAGLAGCGGGGWFGADEDPPLPGERVSVLGLEQAINPDPELVTIPVALPAAQLNTEWAQPGGNATHSLMHPALPANLQRAWSADIGSGSNSRARRLLAEPVVSGNRVFAMDSELRVSAFDARDGDRLWRTDLRPKGREGGFGGGISIAADRVYATTGFGEVLALNMADGRIAWRTRIDAPVRAAPAVADGRVFVVNIDNRIDVVDAVTGEKQWSHTGLQEPTTLLGGASPAVSRDAVLVPYSSGELVALRLANGRQLWFDSLSSIRPADVLSSLSDIRGEPVIAGGAAFATSHSGRTIAVDMRSGARLWEMEFGGVQMPWIAGDFIFLLTNTNELVALLARDGRVRWVTQLPRYEDPKDRDDPIVWSGPVLAGERLVLTGSNEEVVFVSPFDGRVTGTFDVGEPVLLPPVVANNTLYTLDEDGTLSAWR